MPTYIPDMRAPRCCGEVHVSVVWKNGVVTWRCWNPKCDKLMSTYPTVIPDPEPVVPTPIPRDDFKHLRPFAKRFDFV